MDKFIVVYVDEAKKNKYPWAEEQCDNCNLLYETDGNNPIRLVSSDSGEPEDKSLTRDFSWVAEELNKQARIIDALERHS